MTEDSDKKGFSGLLSLVSDVKEKTSSSTKSSPSSQTRPDPQVQIESEAVAAGSSNMGSNKWSLGRVGVGFFILLFIARLLSFNSSKDDQERLTGSHTHTPSTSVRTRPPAVAQQKKNGGDSSISVGDRRQSLPDANIKGGGSPIFTPKEQSKRKQNGRKLLWGYEGSDTEIYQSLIRPENDFPELRVWRRTVLTGQELPLPPENSLSEPTAQQKKNGGDSSISVGDHRQSLPEANIGEGGSPIFTAKEQSKGKQSGHEPSWEREVDDTEFIPDVDEDTYMCNTGGGC